MPFFQLENLDSKFSDIENRLSALEKMVFSKDKKTEWKANEFKGLRGGIRLLIQNRFFDNPRTVKEVVEELKREGYHYPTPSASKALSVDLTNKQKILNRIKGDEQWLYVLRK